MPDITTQISRFFVNSSDISKPGEFVPHTSNGNILVPLVDGDNYFHALRMEVDALKVAGGSGKFFYFASWWLALKGIAAGRLKVDSGSSAWSGSFPGITAFRLDDQLGGPYPDFIDELAAMSANGTDVRALVWINPLIAQYEEAATRSGMFKISASSLLSTDALRRKPGMGKSVCLNLLGHSLGSMHMKMVLCGDSTGGRAYVSGIDFVYNRVDGPTHPVGPRAYGLMDGWHDASARIEGEAVQGIYNYYRQLWKENLGRSTETFRISNTDVESKVDGTTEVPPRTFSSSASGRIHIQVLRTGPTMNFAFFGTDRAPIPWHKRLFSGFSRDKWGPPAQDGIFEFKLSLQKAIGNALRYIYVEDEGFVGQPIMDWLRDRLASNPNLKLIMVHHQDPADGPELFRKTYSAINDHLGRAGVNMNRQVAFYVRQDHVVIHSKTWIIDDLFIILGSANCYRRSLYTDGEVSVAVLDEDATTNHVAVRYRNMLWAEHCGKYSDTERAAFNDLASAIKIWDVNWGIDGAPPVTTSPPANLLPVFQRKKVPFEAGGNADQFPSLPSNSLNDIEYDQYDPDSTLEY